MSAWARGGAGRGWDRAVFAEQEGAELGVEVREERLLRTAAPGGSGGAARPAPPPGAGAEGEPGRRSARRSKHGDPGVRAGVGAGVAGPRACRKGNNKEEGKSLLHPVFPGGLPSKSSPGPTPA